MPREVFQMSYHEWCAYWRKAPLGGFSRQFTKVFPCVFLSFEQALRCIKGPLAVDCRDVRARRVLEQEEGVIMQYVAEIAGLSNFMVSIVERCFEGRVSCRETAVRERS